MRAKKIFFAVGPFLVALLIMALILFSPLKGNKAPSEKDIKQAASSMSVNVIKGNTIKNTAMGSGNYLPFFGSSELSRINAFHPSVLAQKYQRDYTPFLLGAPGTQSLSQFLMIQSMSDELKNKSIVFIISPQWFVKEGISDQMFALYYSPLQTYQWLLKDEPISEESQYIAKRLMQFSSIKTNTTLSRMLTNISEGHSLSSKELAVAKAQFHMLSKEDELFYHLDPTSKQKRINKATKQLPKNYDLNTLETLADKLGKAKTESNPYKISDNFYKNRIAPIEGDLKNSQTKFNYLASPEFGDFQLVLNELAKYKINALFVIPPVNKKWSDYTGLSEEMLNDFSQKITQQLTSQGFNHIADYTYNRSTPYFMEDTIHLGWRGWLHMDQDLQQFLQQDAPTNYHIDNPQYLSDTWQNKP